MIALAMLGACKGKARDDAPTGAARADAAMAGAVTRDAATAPTAALTVDPPRTY